jgi:hypothetical protein
VQETLIHGTVVERQDGLPIRCCDRRGTTVFEAEWAGYLLGAVRLRLPDGRQIVVKARADSHALFGLCDTVAVEDEPIRARYQAVNWANPTHIPPLDQQGGIDGYTILPWHSAGKFGPFEY